MAAVRQASAASRRVIAVAQNEQAYAGQEPITGRRRRPGEKFSFPGDGPLPLARRNASGVIVRGWVQRLDANDEPIEEETLDTVEESGLMDRTPKVAEDAPKRSTGTRPPRANRSALSPAQRAMQVADPNEKRTAKLDPERVAK